MKSKRRYTYSLPDLMYMVLRREEDRTEEQRQVITLLERAEDPIPLACGLTQEFATMARERQSEDLSDWLDRAADSGVREFRTFVKGLRRDEEAVRAALSLAWSNGQTEGQIHRLKLIKHSMYGRASFDLLRQRVLHAA